MKNFFRTRVRTIEDEFFLLGILVAVLAPAAGLLLRLLNLQLHLPPCWFHLLSGYYCPGCGGTRALRALLHGQLLQAVRFHPFVPYAAAVYLYFMITQAVERISHGAYPIGMRYHNGIVWTALALILGSFIVKNVLHYTYGWIL